MPTTAAPRPSSAGSDRTFFVFNAVVSVGALSLLAYLLLVRRGTAGTGVDLRFLPPVNATFNAISAMCLVAGYAAIRQKNVRLHKFCMVAAFAASALFLVCYLAYHFVHGDTHYAGHGPIRTLYLAILASHILLSATILPLALTSFWFAFRGQIRSHKKVVKFTLPIWLYVSVTGVVIYFMLRGSLPAVL